MTTNSVTLNSYRDAIDCIEYLSTAEYQQKGKWDLGRTCFHLNYYYRGSLEGFDFVLPWFLRKMVGAKILKKILAGEHVASAHTIPKSVPPPRVDSQATIAEAVALLERLESNTDPLHPSPLFGKLPLEQWQTLHLVHTAGHLSLLVPTE